ncbi:MAG: ABC transporter transmembrane domain-containing protein, partial [Pseudomonadota bacterium]
MDGAGTPEGAAEAKPVPGQGQGQGPEATQAGAGGARGDERPRSKSLSPLQALAPMLLAHRVDLYGALAALLVAAGFTLAIPAALRRIVDGFSVERAAFIDSYFLAFFGVAFALAIATAARFYFVTRLGERVATDLRAAVYARVVGLGPEFFETIRTGETLSRLTADAGVIQSVVGSTASIALRNIVILIGGVILLLLSSPGLTAMVALIVPVVIVPIVILGRRVRSKSRIAQDKLAEASAFAGETLQATRDVQAFTFEGEARRRFQEATEAAFQAAMRRVESRSMLTAIVIFLAFAAVVGVMWLGARSVIAGEMSAGELVQFVFLAVIVAGSVGALSEIWGELQKAAGAIERLVELLEATDPLPRPAEPVAPPKPAAIEHGVGGARGLGRVRFDAVRFHYPSRPRDAALDGVDLEVSPGETVALVGPSGAGKTTVFQLLLRFYDPDQGAVMLDDVDLRAMAPEAFRARIALVPQEPAIFATSVAENIRFGRPEATDQEVEAAATAAAAHAFIQQLPEGYASEV